MAGWLGAASLGLGAISGCGGSDGYFGPTVRLHGSFNGWGRSDAPAELSWDGQNYRGVVTLPGETIEMQVYVPSLLSTYGSPHAVPRRCLRNFPSPKTKRRGGRSGSRATAGAL
ncbi:MAG: hypothetical protein U0787_19975 [Polyangia bacterium]